MKDLWKTNGTIFREGNVQDTQESLQLNVTHQLLACTDDANFLGGDVNTIKRNTEVHLYVLIWIICTFLYQVSDRKTQ